MSTWSRLANAFRRPHVDADIDEELQAHLDEARAAGRDPVAAARAFGSPLRTREAVRDAIVSAWLDSLMADARFGWRQLLKHKIASAASILSLALGIGASMAAFRLIDALYLRPLPVVDPGRLYVLTYDRLFEGKVSSDDLFDYRGFQRLRSAVADEAELVAIGYQNRVDLTFGSDQDTERVWRQHVSGSMFDVFGLKPALGRLFGDDDDRVPGERPYAVISYDYWSRRFGNDPAVIGRRFRIGSRVLEVIGVAPRGFTGTDPGTFTDVFLPSMMETQAASGTIYCRTWLRPRLGANLDRVRERLSGALHTYRAEQVKEWSPDRRREEAKYFVAAPVSFESATAGWSGTQRHYRGPLGNRRALMIFTVLVGLVLLTACANVANLMTFRSAARSREMALRVSIGAGRGRLVQLVLMESAMVASAASLVGIVFSSWAAPFIVNRLSLPSAPMRVAFAADWRVAFVAIAVTSAVTLLSWVVPAVRVSLIAPVSALKGGDSPHGRRRWMYVLLASQVAFCVLVLFVAGLFIATFERMANQPTGFSAARVLTLETASRAGLPAEQWYQAVQHMRTVPGVESAALAQYALMSFHAQTRYVWANGHSPDGTWTNSTWFLGVSPGWFEAMKLPLLQGRDFRWDDEYPHVAVVNETFARRYFGAESPVGRTFEIRDTENPNAPGGETGTRVSVRIIGLTRDARYEDMRLPIPATAYVPFRRLTAGVEKEDSAATFIVRTKTEDPLAVASLMRREITKAQPAIHVDNVVPEETLVDSQLILERLLATLSLFFAAVALVLAAVGLYGVLHHVVLQRRREIGIRMAIGAQAGRIVQLVTMQALTLVIVGAAAGIAFGMIAVRYVATLLYHVKPTDVGVLAVPVLTILAAAVLAAVPPVIRAVRIDPVNVLRAE
jgi:predicted permease